MCIMTILDYSMLMHDRLQFNLLKIILLSNLFNIMSLEFEYVLCLAKTEYNIHTKPDNNVSANNCDNCEEATKYSNCH